MSDENEIFRNKTAKKYAEKLAYKEKILYLCRKYHKNIKT